MCSMKYIQYVSIQKETKEIDFAMIYSKQKDRVRKSTNEAKVNSRKRSATISNKEKACKRKRTETEKSKILYT